METNLFYFSGTGNCLKVARDLAEALGETEVISIPKVVTQQEITPPADCVGIIYPVYMWGMPLIVAEFIKKLKLNDDQYIFAVATYGGLAGGALRQAADQLKTEGMELSAGFAVAMPGNYTPLYGAISAGKQEEMFKKEKKRIAGIAEIVKARKKSEIEASFGLFNVVSRVVYGLGAPRIPRMDRAFWADDKCNNCGTCQKVCPAQNIKMEDGKPVWMHNCQQCMACLQWCPTEAIQFGRSTVGRRRYHNPNVELADFVLG